MGTPCCQGFVAFLLKFLNFLQTFIGVSIIIYSAYLLNHWKHHNNFLPPNLDSIMLNKNSLPTPWFIYAFMGIGVILCCITCIGHVGAEAVNGCFLCFYSLLMTAFVLVEISLVVFIALDRQWEKDLPRDPTGELHRVRTFIEQNMDVCKWIGIAVIIIQASSLLLAIVLRALVSDHRINHDIEGDYDVIGRTREPLLDPRLSQTSGLAKADARVGHSDIWSSRMREKGVEEIGLAHNIDFTEEITLSRHVGSLLAFESSINWMERLGIIYQTKTQHEDNQKPDDAESHGAQKLARCAEYVDLICNCVP